MKMKILMKKIKKFKKNTANNIILPDLNNLAKLHKNLNHFLHQLALIFNNNKKANNKPI